MRWRKRRGGLIVEVVEPDYLTVAYQTDLTLKYKISAKDDYQWVAQQLQIVGRFTNYPFFVENLKMFWWVATEHLLMQLQKWLLQLNKTR